MDWAKKYMKLDFSRVIFTDECRATLDGPDGWDRGWLRHGEQTPIKYCQQQKGGGVMFWAGILLCIAFFCCNSTLFVYQISICL